MPAKTHNAYKTIGEVANILNNIEPKDFNINTHTLRFWETKFIQLKPKFYNNRRYYDFKTIEILKFIKFLLKSEGLTIDGVKKVLNQNKSKLDDSVFNSIRTNYLKNKLTNIKNIISNLKN